MDAWGKAGNAEALMMVGDHEGALANAMGLTMDASGAGLGIRSVRYSLVAEDGKITALNVEKGGVYEVSSAEAILEAL
jgi:peroxiredoxin